MAAPGMGFYGTILQRRRLALLLVGVLAAHLLIGVAVVAAIIRYRQLWAVAAILWLPLTIFGLRWATGRLRKVFLARDDDMLAQNGVIVEAPAGDAAGERLANVAEEIAIATGQTQPEVAVCQSRGLNAFIAFPEMEGQKHGTVVFTSALTTKLNRHELQAVVAHLYAHRRNFEQMFITMAAAMYIAVFAAADVFLALNVLNWNFGGSGDFSTGPLVVLLVLGMLAGPVAAAWLAQAYAMRHVRFLDDLEALKITHDPESLISSLEKLAAVGGARLEATYAMANAHFYFDAVDDPARRLPCQRPRTHPRLAARVKALSTATGR